MHLLTITEAAQRLHVSVRTLEREVADGKLAIVRVRSRRLVDEAELTRYIAAQSCRYEKSAIAGKSASDWAVAAVLNRLSRQAQPEPTRSRSKFRSAAAKSTLRLVAAPNT